MRTAGPIGLALGAALLLVAIPALWWWRDHSWDEPEVAWGELAAGLGKLLAAAVLAQILINSSPLLLQLLAGPDHAAEVGILTASLIVARIPLFLFRALQAVLLPALAALAVAEKFAEFWGVVRRMAVIVAALGATGVVVAFTVGPAVILRLFGSQYPVDRRTVGLLALARALYMLATTLAQALIALGEATQVALGWGAGVVAMAVIVVATTAMALVLGRARRRGATPTIESALEAINDIAFEV